MNRNTETAARQTYSVWGVIDQETGQTEFLLRLKGTRAQLQNRAAKYIPQYQDIEIEYDNMVTGGRERVSLRQLTP